MILNPCFAQGISKCLNWCMRNYKKGKRERFISLRSTFHQELISWVLGGNLGFRNLVDSVFWIPTRPQKYDFTTKLFMNNKVPYWLWRYVHMYRCTLSTCLHQPHIHVYKSALKIADSVGLIGGSTETDITRWLQCQKYEAIAASFFTSKNVPVGPKSRACQKRCPRFLSACLLTVAEQHAEMYTNADL